MKFKSVAVVLAVLLLIAAIGALGALLSKYNQPLGPSLALDVPTATAAPATKAPPPAATATPASPKSAALAQEAKPTADDKFCGGTGAVNVLVVGSETGEGVTPQGADLVRMVRIDYTNKKIIIYTLPRDLWLDAKNLSDLNISTDTLGHIFMDRYKATKMDNSSSSDKPQDMKKLLAGSSAVAQTLVDDFGLVSDHHITVELERLAGIVDTLGGVTVNVPARFVTDKFTFETGLQTFTGAQAAEYTSHLNKGETEWNRTPRQNLVLDALRQKLVEPAVLAKIPDLYKQFTDAFLTDLTPAQITSFTCMLQSVPPSQIVKDGVQPSMVTPRFAGGLLPDLTAIKAQLKLLGLTR